MREKSSALKAAVKEDMTEKIENAANPGDVEECVVS